MNREFVFERDYSIEDAIKIAKREISRLKFKISIDIIKLTDDIFTTKSIIKNTKLSDNLVVGNGKGVGKASIASSLYELLEHYYSGYESLKRVGSNIKVSYLIDQNINLKNMQFIKEIEKSKESRIKCVRFFSLFNKNKLFYPNILTHPEKIKIKNNSHYKFYSSNNGTAIGITFNEALIHSICEVVERDALSLMYLKNLNDLELKKVNKNTLPVNIKSILFSFENKIGKEVEIVDITSDFGIPVYVSYYETDILPIIGSGCSIDSNIALKRSLLECIQSFHLYNSETELEDKVVLNKFSHHQNIVNCLKLKSLSYIIDDYVEVAYDGTNTNDTLKDLSNIIQRNGYEVYYRIIKKNKNLCCLQTLIPGLENFQMIRYGLPVLPSKRGVDLMKGLHET